LGFFSLLAALEENLFLRARLTFAAFSNPTSISTLMCLVLLRVNLFHLSHGTGQIGAGLVESIERGNLIVIGAREGVLRLNNFNVVATPALKRSRAWSTSSLESCTPRLATRTWLRAESRLISAVFTSSAI